MTQFKKGDIVKISDALQEFCHDFNINMGESKTSPNNTYLVISVNEETLEIEVLSSNNELSIFGFQDLKKINNEQ